VFAFSKHFAIGSDLRWCTTPCSSSLLFACSSDIRPDRAGCRSDHHRYSINDSIVIADRIRENFRLIRGETPARSSIARSIRRWRERRDRWPHVPHVLAMLLFGGEMIGDSRGARDRIVMERILDLRSREPAACARIKREELLVQVASEGETKRVRCVPDGRAGALPHRCVECGRICCTMSLKHFGLAARCGRSAVLVAARHVADETAGLRTDEGTARCPGLERELPEAVGASGGDVGEVQRAEPARRMPRQRRVKSLSVSM